MNWDALRTLYLRQFGSGTREAYRYALQDYDKYCGSEDVDPLSATRANLQGFLEYLIERGLATSTIQTRFGAVNGVYCLALEEEIIPKNPAAKVRVPRIDRASQKRTVLSPLEFAAFLRAAEEMGPNEHGVAALGGLLGLRSAEMIQLTASHVTVMRGYEVITIVAKGNKTHIIPLPVPVMRPVNKLIEMRPTGALLRSKADIPYDRRSLNRCVRRIAARAGIDKDLTPHGLRRTYATSGFMKGVSLRDMQIAMRHVRSDTTLLYDLNRQNLDRHAAHEIAAFLSGFNG